MRRFRFKNKVTVYTLIILFLIIYLFYKIDKGLRPVMLAVCDAEARIVATRTINETIRNEFGNKISYDDIMNIKIDKDGKIVMVQANTVELNRIGAEVALSVQQRIEETGSIGVKIPLGVMLKNDFFAYYGPKVTFKMQPMGSVTTSYRSEFESAGINQTRHIVYLDVTANIMVVVPLAKNYITTISSVPIAESIIVGEVPDFYANLKENGK